MNTRSFCFLAAGALALIALAAPGSLSGQNLDAPAAAATAEPADPRLQSLITEIAAQQVEIARNQAEIEAKVARVSELVRQARIYAGRSGAASKK